MNENDFAENTTLGTPPDTLMDLDFMDELLMEGCWLETSNGSEFLHQSPSHFNALFDASFAGSTLAPNIGDSSPSKAAEERERSFFPDDLLVSHSQDRNSPNWESKHGNLSSALCSSSQSAYGLAGSSELSRRLWIGPRASTSVMERLMKALGYIKDRSGDKNVLIQIWVPVNRGGRRVLMTNDQPFSIDLNCPRLASYRDISVKYQFPTEEDSKESFGFPGLVFKGKVPEWTPDVQFFGRNEYPRVGHAQQYGVRGSLGVPIFEQGSRNCLGVIEVVMTAQKINYRPELESVCQALEAVDLQSSDVSSTENIEVCDFSYKSALPEIQDIFKEACGTHNLLLAQAWMPCIKQGKRGCRHSDENLVRCVSPVDSARYIADPRTQTFNEACLEHHLLIGQGIVGKAFTTNKPCFSSDITTFTKSEYPLNHHARMFGLHAAVALRLRSIYSDSTDFVLEFFLPVDCKDSEEHMRMLSSLSIIIQKGCLGLRVITDEELLKESSLPVGTEGMPKIEHRQSDMASEKLSSWTAPFVDVENSVTIPSTEGMPKIEHRQSDMASEKLSSWTAPFVDVENSVSVASQVQNGKPAESMGCQPDISSRKEIVFGDSLPSSGNYSMLNVSKSGEKKRAKTENSITLETLRQYFAGSLKDAAKSIGVCPTTLKRICRQHGIKRWPSRKIKKVGHSLRKIQRVIDSVEGASGSLQIGSFYSNFPELVPPSSMRADPSPNHAKPSHLQPQDCILSSHVSASKSPSSSCSHSSSSSQCHSTGTQPHPHAATLSAPEDSAVKHKSEDGISLKRVRSDAELHLSSHDGPKPLPRSQSHVSLTERPKSELPPAPQETVAYRQEGTTNNLRMKVTYGEEKIRLRMAKDWGYGDLLKEIGRRFGVDDTSGFHLKYLDDDSEWILMTCDADLEECVDVCQSAQSQTIKVCFVRDSPQHHGSSSGRTYI